MNRQLKSAIASEIIWSNKSKLRRFIGASITEEPMALEALGYELETVMLYLVHLGIGTCWLGGTFNRKGFATAMDIGENKLFPAGTSSRPLQERKRETWNFPWKC